jgi:hypothetical protein
VKPPIKTLLGCCVVIGVNSWAADFTFSYRATGDAEVRPVQIFDDGRQTYFQWHANAADPAIFAEMPDGLQLIASARQGPYVVVPLMANAWVVRFGQLQARVAFAGAARKVVDTYRSPDPAPIPGAGAHARKTYVAPLAAFGAAAPISGDPDQVRFIERDAQIGFAEGKTTLGREAQRMVQSALGDKSLIVKVSIIGRSDGNSPDGLARARAMTIRDQVVQAGVALERVVIREGPGSDRTSGASLSDLSVTWSRGRFTAAHRRGEYQHAQPLEEVISGPAVATSPLAVSAEGPPAAGYVLKKNELIHLALEDWAKRAGWELVWQHPGSWKAMGDTRFDGQADVTQAVSEVIRILRAEGKPVRLRISEGNKVMEVLSGEVRHE